VVAFFPVTITVQAPGAKLRAAADSNRLDGASPLDSTIKVVWIGLPVVVGCDKSAGRVIDVKNRISEHTGNPEAAERLPQRAKQYDLGIGSGMLPFQVQVALCP
jgi:hypothetical protein